ncbi:unnamed protein product [Staurois parvus]|uniref:Uncharacterized protein n=1 Tax=Staurois parvus TaxID=386267 RepID=A0ABN9GYF0_9NEOB|nr:unnamed protein product [Staurois parvus]
MPAPRPEGPPRRRGTTCTVLMNIQLLHMTKLLSKLTFRSVYQEDAMVELLHDLVWLPNTSLMLELELLMKTIEEMLVLCCLILATNPLKLIKAIE